jgi:hypothetical protein
MSRKAVGVVVLGSAGVVELLWLSFLGWLVVLLW